MKSSERDLFGMIRGMDNRLLRMFAWGVSGLASTLAFIVWGQTYDWAVSGIGLYLLFPLFGLLAFSLMWSHYVASVIRQYFNIDKSALADYFELTSGAVLVLILSHPGLLAWQRWRDGFGLPPGSELSYVAPALRGTVIIGIISIIIFLAYELRRFFKDRKWWKFVEYATDVAMLLIYFHALKLGGQLQSGWFKSVWAFYGVTLVACLIYIYYKRLQKVKN